MKVLFISGAMSNKLQKELYEKDVKYGFAVQKFYQLVLEGLKHNDVEVKVLSVIPIPKSDMPYKFKRFKKDEEDSVEYKYIPFFRSPLIYHLFIFLYVSVYSFWWCIRNRKDSFVLYDVLISSRCVGTILGTKLGKGKSLAIVTDMPGMSGERQVKFKDLDLLTKVQMRCIYHSNAFVLLTEQMNDVLNPLHRPYAVMEGLVSSDTYVPKTEKNLTKDILYAGGILESYGLGMLCEAFLRINDDNLRLVFYGNGPFVPKIIDYSRRDSRIEYRGTAMNDEIILAERKSTLLVNPRFTGADYTLYSFPSKNIEFMVSGTPLLTTRLAGIPDDYYPYMFTFDEETTEGYASALRAVLNNSREYLDGFGKRAQEFILNNKNSKVQIERVLKIMSGIY